MGAALATVDSGIDTADADRVLAHLDDVYNGSRAAVEARFHSWENTERNTQLGALKMAYANPRQALERNLPGVVLGTYGRQRWLDLAKLCEQQMLEISAISEEASFDWVIAGTAKATGEEVGKDVKAGLNAGGAFVGGVLMNAIPWWLWLALAAGVAYKLGAFSGGKRST